MVLRGFIDDSGSAEGKTRGDIYTLAGFLSTADRWQAFSDEWESFAAQHLAMPDFHMADAFHMRRQYAGISRDERNAKVAGFVSIIKRYALYRVSSALAWPYYDELVRGRVPKEIDDPFFLLYYNVMQVAAKFLDQAGIEGTIDFVFYGDGAIARRPNDWYQFVRESDASLRTRLGSTPIFRHDNEVLPLKAADIFAWQLRRHLDKEMPLGIEQNEHVDSLMAIPGVQGSLERECLKEFSDNIGLGLHLHSHVTMRVRRVKL